MFKNVLAHFRPRSTPIPISVYEATANNFKSLEEIKILNFSGK